MATTNESGRSTHVFVWAWDIDEGSDDFLAVVDVDRRSARYGQIVSTLPAPGARDAHHVEYELSTNELFASAWDSGRSFVFGLADPTRPTLLSDFDDAGAFSHPHSYARTPSGTVSASMRARTGSRSNPGDVAS